MKINALPKNGKKFRQIVIFSVNEGSVPSVESQPDYSIVNNVTTISSKQSFLSCYDCNTIHDGESCLNMENPSEIRKTQCDSSQPYCKVRTYALKRPLLRFFLKKTFFGRFTGWNIYY